MEKVQNVRKLLLRRLAVATVGVIAGVGMAPPPAQASQTPDLGKAYLRSWSEAIDLEADIDGDELSAEVEAGAGKPLYPRLLIIPASPGKAADDLSVEAEADFEASLFTVPDTPDKAADDFSAEAEAEASAIDRPVLIAGYSISG